MLKKIPIEEIKVGMIFSETLYTKENNPLIPAHVEIKEADYNRLIRWGVKELYTNGELIEKTAHTPNPSELSDYFDAEISNDVAEDYVNLYDSCISIYKDFCDTYQKNGSFDKPKLDLIVKRLIELTQDYKNDIITYIGLNEENYDYITTHAINTTILSIIGGRELRLDDRDMNLLGIAGLLHDIGMLKIPAEIINKKDKLTDEEFKIIKSHPITAFKDMNKVVIFNQVVLDAVLQHHEQHDGNGYPRKLGGDKIGNFAKILSIADAFEAQITRRAYRKTDTGYNAMKSVLAEAQNKFDPKVLRAFLTSLSIYPPGTLLQLNNNAIGAVVSINADAPLRPKIKVIFDEFGDRIENDQIVDLRNRTDLFIVHVLNKDEFIKKNHEADLGP